MTTIAYDGTYLAVDRAGWKANYTFYEVDKLHVVPYFYPDSAQHPCFYAAAGSEGDAIAIMEWLSGKTKDKPDIHEKGDAKGLVVTSQGWVFAVTGVLTFSRVHTVPWADGGGSDMALGAMAAGKGAKKRPAPAY